VIKVESGDKLCLPLHQRQKGGATAGDGQGRKLELTVRQRPAAREGRQLVRKDTVKPLRRARRAVPACEERNKWPSYARPVQRGGHPVLEAWTVRKRPAMYIAACDASGYHHLLWEILDTRHEVINGYATGSGHLHKDARRDHHGTTAGASRST